MSLPKPIVPGAVYLLTRRCFQRFLLLRPSAKVSQIFLFCLAHAAERFSVRIHAYNALSNHFHIVATDVDGRLPEFMHWLDEFVAKCVNAHLGRWESFWAPGSYSAVRLIDPDDILEKMKYVYTNAVAAGLVPTARDWPGARSLPEDLASPPLEVRRPKGFFRTKGPVPETAVLRLDIPDAIRGSKAIEALKQATLTRVREIHRNMRAKGLHFMGRQCVLAQSPFHQPTSREPRRQLNPQIAARDKGRRIEALQRLKAFLQAYRHARQCFLAGDTSVRFPWGTYWMRVHLGVQCSGP